MLAHRTAHPIHFETGGSAGLEVDRVRGPMRQHLLARPAMHTERDLVAHGAGGQEHRRLLAEQLGDHVLEEIHRRILALLLVAHLGVAHESAHRRRRLRQRVAVEIDLDPRRRAHGILPGASYHWPRGSQREGTICNVRSEGAQTAPSESSPEARAKPALEADLPSGGASQLGPSRRSILPVRDLTAIGPARSRRPLRPPPRGITCRFSSPPALAKAIACASGHSWPSLRYVATSRAFSADVCARTRAGTGIALRVY